MGWIIGLLTAAAIGLTCWAVIADAHETARWESWCRDQGGQVRKVDKTVITNTGGKVGTGTETTRYCLTGDGRLLDVR